MGTLAPAQAVAVLAALAVAFAGAAAAGVTLTFGEPPGVHFAVAVPFAFSPGIDGATVLNGNATRAETTILRAPGRTLAPLQDLLRFTSRSEGTLLVGVQSASPATPGVTPFIDGKPAPGERLRPLPAGASVTMGAVLHTLTAAQRDVPLLVVLQPEDDPATRVEAEWLLRLVSVDSTSGDEPADFTDADGGPRGLPPVDPHEVAG